MRNHSNFTPGCEETLDFGSTDMAAVQSPSKLKYGLASTSFAQESTPGTVPSSLEQYFGHGHGLGHGLTE